MLNGEKMAQMSIQNNPWPAHIGGHITAATALAVTESFSNKSRIMHRIMRMLVVMNMTGKRSFPYPAVRQIINRINSVAAIIAMKGQASRRKPIGTGVKVVVVPVRCIPTGMELIGVAAFRISTLSLRKQRVGTAIVPFKKPDTKCVAAVRVSRFGTVERNNANPARAEQRQIVRNA